MMDNNMPETYRGDRQNRGQIVHQVGCYYVNKLFMFVLKETISEHRETFSPDCTRDLIDSFLEEMEVRKKETDSTFNGKMNKTYLPDIRRECYI
jgi:hypothetical protein